MVCHHTEGSLFRMFLFAEMAIPRKKLFHDTRTSAIFHVKQFRDIFSKRIKFVTRFSINNSSNIENTKNFLF